MPTVARVTYPGATHLMPLTEGEWCARLVAEHLDGPGGGTGARVTDGPGRSASTDEVTRCFVRQRNLAGSARAPGSVQGPSVWSLTP